MTSSGQCVGVEVMQAAARRVVAHGLLRRRRRFRRVRHCADVWTTLYKALQSAEAPLVLTKSGKLRITSLAGAQSIAGQHGTSRATMTSDETTRAASLARSVSRARTRRQARSAPSSTRRSPCRSRRPASRCTYGTLYDDTEDSRHTDAAACADASALLAALRMARSAVGKGSGKRARRTRACAGARAGRARCVWPAHARG